MARKERPRKNHAHAAVGGRSHEALWFFLAIFASTPMVSVGVERVEYPLVPWEDIWEEVDQMTANKTDCLPVSSTCWFSKNATEASTNSSSSPKMQCSCDDECVQYGDCCWDKAQSDWGDGREEGSGRYSCHKIHTTGFIGLLMVDSCLPEYANQPVERFCTQQVSAQEYSYLLDLPVTSRTTNTTYINYQCAVCNNDSHHLHNWTVTINCRSTQEFTMVEFMSKAQYMPGRRHWKRYIYSSPENERRNIFRELHDCTLEVEEFRSPQSFAENYGGRLCIYPKGVCLKRFVGKGHCKEQVRQCDPTWPDDLDVEKCRRYSKVVQYTEADNRVTIYKNPHCARCNFVNTSSNGLKCIDPNIENALQKIGPKFLPCFSVLMDFRGEKCKSINELWDPIHLACKRIYCGHLYKLENGLCVRDPTYYHSLENSTLLDHSCPKMELFENDYIPRPDGSVFVNVSKKVYKKGEYEMLKEGTILICNDHRYYTAAFTTTHQLLTLIVLVTSLSCLGLHIIIYLLVPRFRNLPGKNLFSLSCCLFIAHLIFLTGITATYNYGFCVFLSATLHFFWLASFCWMNIMSVDVCRTFTSQVYRGNADGHRNYMYYSIYAWSIPTLVVALSLIFNYTDILPEYKPDYATQLCWMNNLYGLALFFLLPVGAIVLENTIFFFVTSCGIYKQAKAAKYANTRSQSVKGGHEPKAVKKMKYEKMYKQGTHTHALQGRGSKKERVRMVLYLKLGLIQGITWVMGFVAAFSDEPYLWYSFTVLNGLQGAFIFIAFDMKKKVGELVWQAMVGRPWKKHRKSKETRTTTVSQSSSSRNRSSKSESDSDEESRIDSIGDQLVSGEGLNWQAMEGVPLGGTVKLRPSMFAQTKASPQKARKHKTSASTDLLQGPPHTGSLKSPPDPLQIEELSVGQVEGVRNGDLRANVVKGKFEDEGKDDDLRHQPRIGLEDNYISLKSRCQDVSKQQNMQQSNKPNLQHVVDLLQQLQQSKNTEDLPDVVQQLLMRCRGPVGDGQRKSATLSKCKSFSEGANPTLQEEQHKALRARLQLVECAKQSPAIHSLNTSPTKTPAHETQHPPVVTSGPSNCAQTSSCHHEGFPLLPAHLPTQQCKRPKSLSNMASSSHDTSLWSSTKHQMSQVLNDDEELIQSRMKQEKTREVVHPLQRTLKSHSFSQISQVALAAAIMQRAAIDAQEKRCRNEEEITGHRADDGRSLNNNVINQGRTSESLV